MKIHFLPNTDGRIQVCDLLTRNNVHKRQFRPKLSKTDLDKFQQFNFNNLPEMEINDCMKIIQDLNDLVDKQVLSQQIISNVKQLFYNLPNHTFRSNRNICLVRPGLSPNIFLVTDLLIPESKISVPETPSLAFSNINWDSTELCPLRIKELLNNYLTGLSIKNLILLQKQESWINNAAKRNNFFFSEGLLFRTTQLSNGTKVSQLVVPDKLAFELIQSFHSKPFVLHTSANKMQRHLAQVFYIRNFNSVAKQVVDYCKFCLINKTYPGKAPPAGQQIIIQKPGQAISIDLCSVRSGSEIDAFLCIVDNFSKFVVLVPISRNCSSAEIVRALMEHWVQSQGFPISICSDGASNMTSQLMGEVSASLNIRLYRISPGHSQSNLAERFNLLTIQALRIFDQSYKIDDNNFPIILSIVANLLNYMPGSSGFTPFYLQTGRQPRLHPFITFKNLSVCENLDAHAKSLMQAQNVCHILFSHSLADYNKKTTQQKFRVGDFVLLKRLQIQGPRHGHKLKPTYYTEPFRVIRMYRTNAMIVPFNRNIKKSRIKGEGKISKNMATIARLNRLKPLKNPYSLLHLSVNDKILRKFNMILQKPIIGAEVIQPIPTELKKSPRLFKEVNPTVVIHRHIEPPLAVENHNGAQSIRDICPIVMHPIIPGNTHEPIPSIFPDNETSSIQSSYLWKLIPKGKKPKVQNEMLTISSNASNADSSDDSVVQLSVPSQISHHSLIELSSPPSMAQPTMDDYNFSDNDETETIQFLPVQDEFSQESETTQIHIEHPAEHHTIRDMAVMGTSSTPLHTPEASIPSSRPRSSRTLRTRLALPSGRSLILQLDPDSVETIQNIKN